MPRQNRVTPLSDLVADPARGLVYGNRGCLHDDEGTIVRRFAVRRWIACRLDFKGWQRGPKLQPGTFTELFFLDEATAFAAGHRPCRLCRYEDYQAFTEAWATIHPGASRKADDMDRALHEERWDRTQKRQRRHTAALDVLPDGTFVADEDRDAWLVLGGSLLRWTPAGYTDRQLRPRRTVASVITPPSLVRILATDRAPLVQFLHPSTNA